jgi:hypothetical protein
VHDLVFDFSIGANVVASLATPGADFRRNQDGAGAATTTDKKG